MFYSLLFSIVGFFLFQFIFWRRLKEDYSAELIFSLSFVLSGSWLLLKILAVKFLPNWWFWVTLAGSLAIFLLVTKKLKMNPHETYEALAISFLTYFGLFLLSDAVISESIFSFAHSAFVFGIVLLFVFLDTRYKNFSWYKSGRVGFSGLAVMGVYFLVRSLLATSFSFMLSFTVFEIYLSAIFAFINFSLLYRLSLGTNS